ncbi:hypothetical protein BT93_I0013 [Corymbia citriodora subsp. variegata]|nr:hypothetical protein BT93_I0013 [Corymbia citriodora subsp. variegata]
MGESSGSKPCLDADIWAKLVPADSRYSVVDIGSNETVVYSEISCSSRNKHEWCKITRSLNQSSAMIQNKSSTTILIDGATVQSEDIMLIQSGTEIIPGPDREGHLSYRFEMIPAAERCEKRLKISIDVENAKCGICLNIWHDVISVAPCLHNFCNGCFSEWLRRSQERSTTVLCPQCRAVVQFAGKNHFLREVVEDILQADSSLRRPKEDVAVLDSHALIQSNLIISGGRKRKKPHLAVDEQTSGLELSCPQCGLGCNRAFCGAYWHSQGVARIDSHPLCLYDTFKPIMERCITRIPLAAHETNQYEQDITERSIRQLGRTLQDVISEWIGKFDNHEIDRSRMPLNHAEVITAATHICNFYHQMHLREKIVGMDMHVARSTTMRNMLGKEITFVVQPGGLIRRPHVFIWLHFVCVFGHVHARKQATLSVGCLIDDFRFFLLFRVTKNHVFLRCQSTKRQISHTFNL